jgi:hypothetical protein
MAWLDGYVNAAVACRARGGNNTSVEHSKRVLRGHSSRARESWEILRAAWALSRSRALVAIGPRASCRRHGSSGPAVSWESRWPGSPADAGLRRVTVLLSSHDHRALCVGGPSAQSRFMRGSEGSSPTASNPGGRGQGGACSRADIKLASTSLNMLSAFCSKQVIIQDRLTTAASQKIRRKGKVEGERIRVQARR